MRLVAAQMTLLHCQTAKSMYDIYKKRLLRYCGLYLVKTDRCFLSFLPVQRIADKVLYNASLHAGGLIQFSHTARQLCVLFLRP